MSFLMNSRDSKLENLKLMHAGLSLNEDMVSLLPKTLKRIYLSNTNRPDPSFVNAKQLNYGSPLEAHLWGGLFKRCNNLELFIHNSSGSPSVYRLEKSKWSHLKTKILLLRSGEMLKTSNLTDYERIVLAAKTSYILDGCKHNIIEIRMSHQSAIMIALYLTM